MEGARPFKIRRAARAGASLTGAPYVLEAEWTEVIVDNLVKFAAKPSDIATSIGCSEHRACRGHHITTPAGYPMIPQGFAMGDELSYSDSAMLNLALYDGSKGSDDLMKFCMDKIKGKQGILRKSCNSTRPTNTARFVASPTSGPPGEVVIPDEMFTKGQFMMLNADGYYTRKKLQDGDLVVIGRCPSMGADSALPMIARRATDGVSSMRVPLEVCPLTNLDFDGDEMWVYVPSSRDSIHEIEEAWYRVWEDVEDRGMLTRLREAAARAMVSDDSIDVAMYTTMPLDDMADHEGGEMYDLLWLKQPVWKTMSATVTTPNYWAKWVDRSLQGIVNAMMSKHGIGKPYVDMRNVMMLGTIVNPSEHGIVVEVDGKSNLPAVRAPPSMTAMSCSSGLTKMNRQLYQLELDLAKHGTSSGKPPAVSLVMKESDRCYGLADNGNQPSSVILTYNSMANSRCRAYTSMKYIASASDGVERLSRATMVVGMIMGIDGVRLTKDEVAGVATLLAYVADKHGEVASQDMIKMMVSMKADWYTSITCSNISWLRRKTLVYNRDPSINMCTTANSLLGSLFLGNMFKFAPFMGTVRMNSI